MTVTLISWNKDAENTISLEEWLGNLRTQQKLADDEFEFRMDVTEFTDEASAYFIYLFKLNTVVIYIRS